MTFTKPASEIFRDYVTDGNPLSGAHKPIKADIRQWGTELALACGLMGDPKIVTAASDTIAVDDGFVIINRSAPAATALTILSPVSARGILVVIDLSESVTEHVITIVPDGTDKIMRQNSWTLYSTAAALASVRLVPLPSLSNWIIV